MSMSQILEGLTGCFPAFCTLAVGHFIMLQYVPLLENKGPGATKRHDFLSQCFCLRREAYHSKKTGHSGNGRHHYNKGAHADTFVLCKKRVPTAHTTTFHTGVPAGLPWSGHQRLSTVATRVELDLPHLILRSSEVQETIVLLFHYLSRSML